MEHDRVNSTMNDDDINKTDLNEVELQRRVRELDTFIAPQRDLWQGIERRITALPQRGPLRERVLSFGVAASFMMAAAALILSIGQFQSGRIDVSESLTNQSFTEGGFALMGLGDEAPTGFVDPKTRSEIFQSLAVLVQARAELYRQIQENPTDHRLRDMLVKVRAQERALLALEFGQNAGPFYQKTFYQETL